MDKKKINSRQMSALDTKKRIYDTANRLFRAKGFQRVSVDTIVETAKVSKGSFYVHFESKDALLVSLIGDYVNEIDLDYKNYILSLDMTSASDILMSLVGKIADVLTHSIGYDHMNTLYRVQLERTINMDAISGYNRDIYKMFNDILQKGVEQDEFITEIPVDILSRHLMIAFRGLTYEWCIRHPDFDLKEQALKHFEIFLKGIKKH